MRQSRKFGGKKLLAYSAMLPESRIKSPGRMSAPFHDATNTASTSPQPNRVQRLRLGKSAAASAAAGTVTGVVTRKTLLYGGDLLVQLRELGVDLGDLGLLVGLAQGGVALDLGLGFEQLELTDRVQLVVAGNLEARIGELGQDFL